LVITDLAMPGSSGLEAIQRILRAEAAARVLMFSMQDSKLGVSSDIELTRLAISWGLDQSTRSGVDDFAIVKPAQRNVSFAAVTQDDRSGRSCVQRKHPIRQSSWRTPHGFCGINVLSKPKEKGPI
jgi:CheY-like chemotaxis protein